MDLGWKAEHKLSHRMNIWNWKGNQRDLIIIYLLDPRESPNPILKAFETNGD